MWSFTFFTGGLIGTLPDRARHRISGNFYIVDSKTIFIENFNYDATAPGNNIILAGVAKLKHCTQVTKLVWYYYVIML